MCRRTLLVLAAFVSSLLFSVELPRAQYFGQNKVIYDDFDFRILKTEHFDVYYYPEEEPAIEELARMAERWYARHVDFLGYELKGRQPLIMYASSPHFRQTNVVSGVGQGTGGVTESLRRRIIMPFAGPLKETDHVLGHELVHAFQYGLAGGRPGLSATGAPIGRLPLWFIEGMAEYLSLGPEDPLTAMWMRDATKTMDELPSVRDLANPSYFPYRWGQALLAYIGGRWGDETIASLLQTAGKSGNINEAIQRVLSISPDTLSKQWHQALHETYDPLVDITRPPDSYGKPLITADNGGELNIAPALSPDGKYVLFFSEKDLFSIDLFLAETATGKIVRKVVETSVDAHFSSLEFISSAGAWAPDSRRIVFAATTKADPTLTIIDVETGDTEQEIVFDQLGEIINPTWSPDGRYIAFSALAGGFTDLFMYDMNADSLHRLTDDAYSDIHPAWSPQGNTIAFVTDRFTTDLSALDIGPYGLALISPETGSISQVRTFDGAAAVNPQWSQDGQELYFVSSPNGIRNIYRASPNGGTIDQITDLYTGVSGITSTSPCLSVATDANVLAFAAYEDSKYNIYFMESPSTFPVAQTRVTGNMAVLPPQDRATSELVTLLQNESVGLPPATGFTQAPYSAGLSVDYISQPYLAAGADALGVQLGGGIALYWSDMLSNQQLITGLQLQTGGGFTDVAALLGYFNQKSRWNWGGAVQQIPYTLRAYALYDTTSGGRDAVAEAEYSIRQTNREATAILSYPFNRVHRVEFSGGFEFISFDRKINTRVFDPISGQLLSEREEDLPAPDGIGLGTASAALVFDNAVYGATSPLLGQRYRAQVQPVFGSIDMYSILADYRRYFVPVRPFTLAFRVMHYGRYGGGAEDDRLTPIFLGYQDLVRGYTAGSFEARECDGEDCPVYTTLFGSKIAVFNAELRFPLLGLLGAGGGYYGAFPLEVGAFYDAGVAWTKDDDPWFLDNGPRDAVSSWGLLARANVFGFVVVQVDWVTPLDRPEKGSFWQFSISPGF